MYTRVLWRSKREKFGFHPRITVIALTGGPSAGKTTVLAVLRQWLENRGFKVAIIPEVATELISAGFSPFPQYWTANIAFQYHVLAYSLDREQRYYEMLEDSVTDKPMVLIVDRGTLDGIAYCGKREFLGLLESMDLGLHALRERYKAVIHLETGAAKDAFTTENNTARSENAAQALDLDKRTYEAWSGHQHHIRVGAQDDFEAKKLDVLKTLSRIVNVPEPYEIERKWRVDNFHPSLIPAGAGVVEIVQTYLLSPSGSEHRVRMRTADGSSSYFETKKYPTYNSSKRIEKEYQIDRNMYEELLLKADPDRAPVRKTRHSWVYDNRTIELDEFDDVIHDGQHLVTLEVEIPDIDTIVHLPPEFECVEVTSDTDYKNGTIARLIKLKDASRLVFARAA